MATSKNINTDDLLKTCESGEHCKLSSSKMAKMRVYGGGPRFLKLGRSVRYRRSDLDAWLAVHERANTAPTGETSDAR